MRQTTHNTAWRKESAPNPHPLSQGLRKALFGQGAAAADELLRFQYHFLMVLMLAGALLTALLILGSYSGDNPIAARHLAMMHVFTAVTLLLWWTLRGHPARLRGVAWAYEGLCLIEFSSALIFVPGDELRLLWFFVNLPGVFIMLGVRAGWVITGLSLVAILICPAWSGAPYSRNAIATAVSALLAMAVNLHVLSVRALSFYQRMQTAHNELERLASRDGLTGVFNARAFHSVGEATIAAMRRSQLRFSVLFIDLDHFKSINDQHGHAAGDTVLTAVSALLTERVRQSDQIGRLGGEEFGILLPDTETEGAQRLAESLRAGIEALCPKLADGQRLRVTASIGVTSNHPATTSLAALLQRADQAMYLAKQAGRNRVTVLATD